MTDSADSEARLRSGTRSNSPVRGANVGEAVEPANARRMSDEFYRSQPTQIEQPRPKSSEPLSLKYQRVLFWVPVFAACVSVVGAAFSIRNWAYLDASKTLNFVKTLSPALTGAHEQIMQKLNEIVSLLRNDTRRG